MATGATQRAEARVPTEAGRASVKSRDFPESMNRTRGISSSWNVAVFAAARLQDERPRERNTTREKERVSGQPLDKNRGISLILERGGAPECRAGRRRSHAKTRRRKGSRLTRVVPFAALRLGVSPLTANEKVDAESACPEESMVEPRGILSFSTVVQPVSRRADFSPPETSLLCRNLARDLERGKVETLITRSDDDFATRGHVSGNLWMKPEENKEVEDGGWKIEDGDEYGARRWSRRSCRSRGNDSKESRISGIYGQNPRNIEFSSRGVAFG
jgi:hypothetical protein